jgi:hypothetical protein
MKDIVNITINSEGVLRFSALGETYSFKNKESFFAFAKTVEEGVKMLVPEDDCQRQQTKDSDSAMG